MAQQLNLFDRRFAPHALRFSARHGLLAVVALLGLSAGAARGLQWATAQTNAQTSQLALQSAPLAARQQALQASGPGTVAGEITQLRGLEAGQRRMDSALNAGLAGAREGPSDYLVALARRASGALWITSFAVDDGGAIALEGRMTDTAVLTDYLKSLNNEPRFKGRPFAQLSLQSQDASGLPTPYTEFTLRSTSATAGSTSATAGPASPGGLPTNIPAGNAMASVGSLLGGQPAGGTP